MKRNGLVVLVGIFTVMLFSSGASAEMGAFALAAKVGTLGVGPEVTAGINDRLNARLGANLFSYDYDTDVDDIDYEFDLDLLTVGALLDWHPMSSGLRVTAGLVFNGNELDGYAKSQSTYTIGDTVYTGDEVGELNGKVDFNSISPYIGVGWGNAVGADKHWNFVLDVGVMFQGSPDVDLSADGPISSDPAFAADLKDEKDELEDDLEDFEVYPVIAIGVSYRF